MPDLACLPFARRRIAASCAFALTLLTAGTAHADRPGVDLSTLPIEQLLELEVYSASKFVQKISDAPSAVSVVTSTDIKTFGWRTLADILRSMRGLYVSYDRNYSYLGARGFFRPGDYNTRFLVLVDGNRINDAVFDQGTIGTEFIVDVDLIDRVEFVPGPGSSIYGANAFFGVINVITKRGRDFSGPQVSAAVGSDGMRKLRATHGMRGDGGAELLLSATTYRTRGEDLYFAEFDTPGVSDGFARRLDHDRSDSVFIKAALGAFSVSFAHSERKKGVPTASYSQVFNDPRSHTVDRQSVIDLGYRTALDDGLDFFSRLYSGHYTYQGDYVYGTPAPVVNRDGSRAQWWGGEAKLVNSRVAGHKMVAGVELQRDSRRDQFNFDIDPYSLRLDDRRTGHRSGVYLQDEVTLRDDLLLNAGMRYDHNSSTEESSFNPRVAVIYKATPVTTVKATYGSAFRAPNAYELYYQVPGPGGQKASSGLRAERIHTRELIVEHYLGKDARLTASAFMNAVSNLITQTTDPADDLLVFRNLDKATTRGIELELEKAWAGGAKLRTSYSFQRARDEATGNALVNSPRHLAKLNLSVPVSVHWRTGFEGQYVGPRDTLRSRIGGYWLGNLTVSSVRLAQGVEVAASVYNLFNRRYADPGAAEHAQDAIGQDGRAFRLMLTYAF